MEFLDFLSLGWVGSVIGILGLAYAIIAHFQSKKNIAPCYQYKTTTIIDKEKNKYSNDIDVIFKGKSVSSLNRTIIAVWNDGKKYLDKKDILDSSPLTLSFSKGEILSYKVKDVKNKSMNVNLNLINEKSLVVKFEYIDYKDGFSLEIIHTSPERCPSINCVIKGVKKGFENKGKIVPSESIEGSFFSNKINILLTISLIIGFLSLCLGFFSIYVKAMIKNNNSVIITNLYNYLNEKFISELIMDSSGIGFVIIGFIYIIFYCYILFLTRRVPKNIDIS